MSDKKEAITVQAFKSMIEGMDMIGGEDWSPTPDQWKRIRVKIEQLDESVEAVERVVQARPADIPGSRLIPEPRPDAVVNSDNPWENGTGRMPDVPGSVPAGPVEMGASQSALTPNPTPTVPQTQQNPAAPVAHGGEEAVKTPDIDSSAGYDSPFA